MSEDLLKLHFGPDTGSAAPHITDAHIAMQAIVDSRQVFPVVASEHPVEADNIVDGWPDEGLAE